MSTPIEGASRYFKQEAPVFFTATLEVPVLLTIFTAYSQFLLGLLIGMAAILSTLEMKEAL